MIGLLPAAGQATRMNGLPKWMLPAPSPGGGTLLIVHFNRMHEASCRFVRVGARPGNKRALEQHIGRNTVYLALQCHTMSETILSVLNVLQPDKYVLFGMPDTYFEDVQAYRKLADALGAGAQVAVGLFHTRPEQRSSLGVCRMEGNRVIEVIDKPEQTDLEWAWGVLGWQPVFWDYIKPEDPHVGYAIPRAIADGLDVRAVFMDGRYWDCGTPEEYFHLIRSITSETTIISTEAPLS